MTLNNKSILHYYSIQKYSWVCKNNHHSIEKTKLNDRSTKHYYSIQNTLLSRLKQLSLTRKNKFEWKEDFTLLQHPKIDGLSAISAAAVNSHFRAWCFYSIECIFMLNKTFASELSAKGFQSKFWETSSQREKGDVTLVQNAKAQMNQTVALVIT